MTTPQNERGITDVSSPVNPTLPELTGGVTLRVVLFSLLLAALFGYCIPIVDFQMSNTFLGAMHMPAAAIATLIVLLLVINPLLGLLWKRAQFSRNEMLVVYITCLFSSLVPGRGAENFIIPTILSPFYNATRENRWQEMLSAHLPSWMSPASHGREVAAGWYEGTGGVVPWGVWLIPLLAWGTLVLALYVMQGCLGVMLRAQWAQREALAFPLLRLPLEMTEDAERANNQESFWKNPLIRVGASVSVFIQLLNGLHLYFPDVPEVPLSLPTGQFFTEVPWNQLGIAHMQIFPAIVGITFLLTSEVSFSLWFFHLFSKFQYFLAYLCGYQVAALETPFWTRGWAKGFIGYQQVGALLMYVFLIVWTGREHWKHIGRRAFGKEKISIDEQQEALSYPVAFWGFFLSLSLIVGWTIAAGVSPHVALLLWAFYLAVSLGLTRLVAEAGLLFVQTGWMPIGPLAFLVGAGPGRIIDVASATPASFISAGFMLDMRGFLLPSFVQGFKLAHDRKISMKPLMALIAGVTLISLGVSWWSIIRLGYERGGLTLQPWWGTGNWSQAAFHSENLIRGLDTSLASNWGWVGVGAGLTWAIMYARLHLVWFPLHPIGLLMMVPFAMHSMWASIFCGWAAKVTIIRFGGNEAYRRTIPLFLGLALGDIMMSVFWVLIDGWQGRTGHALLPF